MITCGIDIGSSTIEAVLFNGDSIVEYLITDTGVYPAENANSAFEIVLNKSGLKRNEIDKVISTGYGRNYFNGKDLAVSEILCHSAGVHHYFPNAETVIDIGGQDSKVMQLDGNAKVIYFNMNDRCAAGTGKFIEMVANTLKLPLEETGLLALSTNDSCQITSMCAVFAESEIISLIHRGIKIESILKGVFKSIAKRVRGMTGKFEINSDVIFTGGVAKNPGVVRALNEELGAEIKVPVNPQITGALGAAIIGAKGL